MLQSCTKAGKQRRLSVVALEGFELALERFRNIDLDSHRRKTDLGIAGQGFGPGGVVKTLRLVRPACFREKLLASGCMEGEDGKVGNRRVVPMALSS